jgi:hypothetical protein
MDIDFGRLKDWNGLTFHATGVWQFGKNLGADIGVKRNKLCGLLEALPHVPACVSVLVECRRELARA